MAGAAIAIKLPNKRQSRHFDGSGPDVHDPNYIPVLNGAEIKVDFSKPSFSARPSIPTPHSNTSQTSLMRSKSGCAPETVVQYASMPLPQRQATILRSPQEIESSHVCCRRTSDHASSAETHAATGSVVSPTAPTTAAALEDQVFMIPGNSAPKIESVQLPTVPHSARSSISSTRKSQVPTSRYNKRVPSIPSIPAHALRLQSQSLMTSCGATPESNLYQQNSETPRLTLMPPSSMEMSPITPLISHARLHISKSTASERRARALHSHPSNLSLRSGENSTLDEADEVPLVQQPIQTESRPSSSRSRSQSICNSQPTTPAPDAPLPDLPPIAKRPPTREKPREKQIEKPLAIHSPASTMASPPTAPQNEHVELADFMTTKKTTVFRRFDDVHVRLLLHLQDEISALEKELSEIEQAGYGQQEKIVGKAGIMRELRKILAEYDHLFTNWSSMQANKATTETKEQLTKWLQSPSAEAVSKGAKADLEWLQDSKDLSAVSIDPEKKPAEVRQKSVAGTKTEPVRSEPAPRLFASLFGSCAGKRR